MTLDQKLFEAAMTGNLEEIKRLVEQGVDIHSWGDYALRLASHNGHIEVVKYLVEQGANIHALNDAAFRYAFTNGHTKVVKYLEAKMLQNKRIAGLEKLKCL